MFLSLSSLSTPRLLHPIDKVSFRGTDRHLSALLLPDVLYATASRRPACTYTMTDLSPRAAALTLALLLAPFACGAPTPNRAVRDVGAGPPPTFAAKRSAYDPFASALDDLATPDLNYSSIFAQQPIRGNDSVEDVSLWRRQTASACLDSTATDVTINLMLFHGASTFHQVLNGLRS